MFIRARVTQLMSLSSYTRDGIIQDAIGIEGGDANDPMDSGGATRWGITQAVAEVHAAVLKSTYHWDGSMANLSQAMATYIYIQDYWNALDLDAVLQVNLYTPLLADLLFEAGINIGIGTVAKYLQTGLNVLNNQGLLYRDILVDGAVGAGTVGAISALLTARPHDGLQNLLWMISAQVQMHYLSIAVARPSQERFEAGWSTRARVQYHDYLRFLPA